MRFSRCAKLGTSTLGPLRRTSRLSPPSPARRGRCFVCGMTAQVFVLLPALLCFPVPCRSEINTCIGFNGELYFTDRECPPGFSLSTSVPATPSALEKDPFEDEWFRFCQYISVMTVDEVDAAIATIEKIRTSFKEKSSSVSSTQWETCFSRLTSQRSTLTSNRTPADVKPRSLPEKDSPTHSVCREGILSTENHSQYYDVYFTNSSKNACQTVKAYCLCSVGAYEQSREIMIKGRFAPGAKIKLTSISTTGPAGRDIAWSWCKFKY